MTPHAQTGTPRRLFGRDDAVDLLAGRATLYLPPHGDIEYRKAGLTGRGPTIPAAKDDWWRQFGVMLARPQDDLYPPSGEAT